MNRSRAEKLLWLVVLAAAVFFGRWWMIGLQPDAALYAGLSYKVFKTGEAWLLAGTPNKFEIYFEHPPYFFQWGAQLFRALGVSEGVARAIGGLPAYAGLLLFTAWLWRRMGWLTACLSFLLALSFGHYTKYAATSMLEAPLSLATVVVAIATFELNWRPTQGRWRAPLWLALAAGLMLATAAKGVAGLGAFGGLTISVFMALLFSVRAPFKVLFSSFSLGLFFLISLVPFGYWFYELSRSEDIERFVRYIIDQVLRSATSNRGEEFHALGGDRLYYLKVLLRDAAPWGWAWIVGIGWLTLTPARLRPDSEMERAWAFNSFAFLLAFGVPFSIVTYQLPHYLHPVYLLLMPNAAFLLRRVLPAARLRTFVESVRIRWALALLACVLIPVLSRGVTRTENRGQDFVAVAGAIITLPPTCQILVLAGSMDAYRMEAFAMWYFRAREWVFTPKALPSAISVPSGKLYWDPQGSEILGGSGCR